MIDLSQETVLPGLIDGHVHYPAPNLILGNYEFTSGAGWVRAPRNGRTVRRAHRPDAGSALMIYGIVLIA